MSVEKKGIKILLVDDDDGVRTSFTTLLTRKGYDIDPKSSGMEAVNSLKKTSYDILLTDLKMPNMNGLDLLKEARKIDSELGVIIMTGYGEIASYLEAMDLGAVEYLNKPVKTSDLEVIIKRLLHGKKANIKEA